jgi:uncharacterized cupin superfamily protein
VRRFNLFAPEFDHASARDGYRRRGARVGQAVGAAQIGASLYELEDGQGSHPYHFHHGVEEWLIVVAGAPRVRTPEGERVLRTGDVLCFPAGAEGAHEVTGPGTVLIVAEVQAPDVLEYPDDGTLEVRPPGMILHRADSRDRGAGG